MFGLKKFNDTKTSRFENDKKRKQHFAISNYYKSKKATVRLNKTSKKK